MQRPAKNKTKRTHSGTRLNTNAMTTPTQTSSACLSASGAGRKKVAAVPTAARFAKKSASVIASRATDQARHRATSTAPVSRKKMLKSEKPM